MLKLCDLNGQTMLHVNAVLLPFSKDFCTFGRALYEADWQLWASGGPEPLRGAVITLIYVLKRPMQGVRPVCVRLGR